MMVLPLKSFCSKYITPVNRLSSPKVILSENLVLPTDSVIHYIADSAQVVGIDNTDTLMRNVGNNVLIYHVTNLDVQMGNVTTTHIPLDKVRRLYHKMHLYMREVKNLERTLNTVHSPVVINYSMLPMLHRYSNNQLVVYQEWYNLRYTLWRMIDNIKDNKQHFIKYTIPDILPTRQHLITYLKTFTASGMSIFHTDEEFNILELWRMISSDVDSIDMMLSMEAIEQVNLVFVESGQVVILQLAQLLSWAKLDSTNSSNSFYHFLDHMVSLRTKVVMADEDVITPDTDIPAATPTNIPVVNTKIISLIKEYGAIGALSEAEQKGLVKLAQRYRSVVNPWDLKETLDKVVVTHQDIVIIPEQLMANKPSVIHDDSMLKSTLKTMDTQYINKVYHKDIIQSILKFHDSGVIVKDINIKPKITATTKSEVISVQLQPVGGAASTIQFTLPVISKEGTFTSGGIKYRLDKQHGGFKPYTM